jgi:putative ABC transport system substrate-binding protein
MGDAVYAAKAAQPAGIRDPIPIVFGLGDDPVATGLVSSLNRPGGHLTGGTSFGHSLGPKKLELLREVIPTAKAFGLLVNPKQAGVMEAQEIERAAVGLGVNIQTLNVRGASEIEETFRSAKHNGIEGLIVSVDTMLFAESERLGLLAARYRIPTVASLKSFAVAGGLMSFNGNVRDIVLQTAIYTGRIVKGEKPADLPVHLPTKYDLVLNLKAAKEMGLSIPLPLLGRADEVIE